ncbi:MAG: chorismate mutase [Actinomycetota bacterium]|nr:chorismate mutase [Actinomycetota bacterium]
MPATAVRAIRGATTLDEDTPAQMHERVTELVRVMLERNGLATDDLISMLLTSTDDLHCMFPATAARTVAGMDAVPLMCARELDIDGGLERCVRIMAHVETTRTRAELEHVFLAGAVVLRPDLEP